MSTMGGTLHCTILHVPVLYGTVVAEIANSLALYCNGTVWYTVSMTCQCLGCHDSDLVTSKHGHSGTSIDVLSAMREYKESL